MQFPPETNENACPRTDIAAYIDGELAPSEEMALEMHLAKCPACANELNEQKKLLCALDFSFENEKEFELPENFTKIVVANAESSVSGLRRPKERFNALFISAALFLLIIFGLGNETGNVLHSTGKIFEQILAVVGFAAHLIYDIAIGTTVIVRSLFFLFVSKSGFSIIFLLLLFGISALIFSRLMFRSVTFNFFKAGNK
jgi:predicted anti-sigma-YlaC factor YlaD